MPAFAVLDRPGTPSAGPAPDLDLDLEDAREALAYWEDRARRLPVRAVRRRREAREMAARWRARVAEAERAAYGRGLLGLALMLATERRRPEPARHAGRRLARRSAQVAVVVAVAAFALLLAVVLMAVELLVSVAQALG
jgi:hypothetical protein